MPQRRPRTRVAVALLPPDPSPAAQAAQHDLLDRLGAAAAPPLRFLGAGFPPALHAAGSAHPSPAARRAAPAVRHAAFTRLLHEWSEANAIIDIIVLVAGPDALPHPHAHEDAPLLYGCLHPSQLPHSVDVSFSLLPGAGPCDTAALWADLLWAHVDGPDAADYAAADYAWRGRVTADGGKSFADRITLRTLEEGVHRVSASRLSASTAVVVDVVAGRDVPLCAIAADQALFRVCYAERNAAAHAFFAPLLATEGLAGLVVRIGQTALLLYRDRDALVARVMVNESEYAHLATGVLREIADMSDGADGADDVDDDGGHELARDVCRQIDALPIPSPVASQSGIPPGYEWMAEWRAIARGQSLVAPTTPSTPRAARGSRAAAKGTSPDALEAALAQVTAGAAPKPARPPVQRGLSMGRRGLGAVQPQPQPQPLSYQDFQSSLARSNNVVSSPAPRAGSEGASPARQKVQARMRKLVSNCIYRSISDEVPREHPQFTQIHACLFKTCRPLLETKLGGDPRAWKISSKELLLMIDRICRPLLPALLED